MSVCRQLLTPLMLLSLAFTPSALAKKQKPLNFQKQSVNASLAITGELTSFTIDQDKTHLLIQSGRSFTHISDIGNGPLAKSIKTINMPDNVLFYNKGRLANVADDVLFYFTGDEVWVYHLKTATRTKLFSVDSFYKGLQSVEAKQTDFVVDINQDGLSDVITSNFEHANVYLQTPTGEFKHQQLDLAPDSNISRNGVNFSEHQAVVMDANKDGLSDLGFQIDNELHVFVQDKPNHFAPSAVKISLNAGILNLQQQREMDASGKKTDIDIEFKELLDVNGDGLMDVVTEEEKREGMMSSTSEYPVRYGRLNNGFLSYAAKSDTVMVMKGQGDIKFADINNDGLQDYYTVSLELGVGAVMGFMSGSIDMDLHFYPMNKNQAFAKKPAYEGELEVLVDMDDNDSGSARPLLEIEDFNGDGVKDLIKQTDDDEFRIFYGGSKRLFAKRGAKYDIDLPVNGSVEAADYNGDGKTDLLFRFGKNKGNNKLTLWLSRTGG